MQTVRQSSTKSGVRSDGDGGSQGGTFVAPLLELPLERPGGAGWQGLPDVEGQAVLPGAVESSVANFTDLWLDLAPESARRHVPVEQRIGNFLEEERHCDTGEDEDRTEPTAARHQREAQRQKSEGQ